MKYFIYIITIIGLINTASANTALEKTSTTNKSVEEKRLASLDKNPINKFEDANLSFSVLSDNDIKIYKQLFKEQRNLNRTKVSQLIRNLEDKSLLGHLMAVRLLHPNTKASYNDLKSWLASYNDHHQAKQIYNLANIRKPKSETAHNKPVQSKGHIAKYTNIDDNLQKPSDKDIKNTTSRKQLLTKVNYYLKKDKFIQAEKLLDNSTNRRLMGDSTYANYGLKLTKKLYNSEKFIDAHRVASKIATTIKPMVHEAVWYEGLAAYQAKRYTKAANAFRRLANNVPGKSKYYSKASYWAALSYQKSGKKSMEKVFLKQASANKYDFYGLLANEQLGQSLDTKWKKPKVSEKELKLLLNNEKVRRVIALAEINEYDLAQKELRAIYADIPYGMDEALLKMALDLNLSGNALTLSHNLLERNNVFLTGLYPDINNWKPKHSSVDYSLINAVIRQESAFNPSVKSGVGAMGLMQIMPGTATYIRHLQGKSRLSNHYVFMPKVNVSLGQYYLGYLLEEFNGNLVHAIAAYNAGPGNVKKWIEKDLGSNDPMAFIESIPFPETRKYVKKVMANYWVYRSKFNQTLSNLHQLSQNRWPKDTYSLAFRVK